MSAFAALRMTRLLDARRRVCYPDSESPPYGLRDAITHISGHALIDAGTDTGCLPGKSRDDCRF